MFEKFFKKESKPEDIRSHSESAKRVDLFMNTIHADVLESNEQAIVYELDEDISTTNVYESFLAENPDLTITCSEGMYGKYEVMVVLKNPETTEAVKEDELV